jgi:molecular chaperone HtpG
MFASGKINVSVENIFPLIKKISQRSRNFPTRIGFKCNRCNLKLKHLTSIGEA